MAITRSEYEAYKAKRNAGSSPGTGAGSSGSGSGSGGIGRSAYEAYKEKLRKREEEAAAEREERKKIEAEVERLRLMRKNAATQSRINAATEAQNAQKAIEKVRSAARESAAYAKYAGRTAYTDTGSSRDSYEDRVKAAEVERIKQSNRSAARESAAPVSTRYAGPTTVKTRYTPNRSGEPRTPLQEYINNRAAAEQIKKAASDKAKAEEQKFAHSDRAASRHLVTKKKNGEQVKRFVYGGKEYSLEKLVEKLDGLTDEELKERSEVSGLTKGELRSWARERYARDQIAAYKKYTEDYKNSLTADVGALKSEYDRVAAIKNEVDGADSAALEKLKTERPDIYRTILYIAQENGILPQDAYGKWLLRMKHGYSDYETLENEVAKKGNQWASARDNQRAYKFVQDAKADPEFETRTREGKSRYNGNQNIVHFAREKTVDDAVTAYSRAPENAESWAKYVMMTDDEARVYDYYLATSPSDATEYLNSIDNQLIQRWAYARSERIKDNFFLKVNEAAMTGVEQFANGVYRKIAPAQEYYYPTLHQYTSAILTQDMGGFEKFWYDLGVNVANMAPSIIVGKLASYINPVFGEVLGAATMGLSASGNAYAEAVNSGMTHAQASAYSNLIGISETMLQTLMGGIPYAGGVLNGKIFTKAGTRVLRFAGGLNSGMAKLAKVVGYGLKYFGGSVGEMFEEGLQEILEPYFRSFVTGEAPDDVDWGAVFYNAGMGFATSLLLGGADTAGKRISARSKASDVIGRGGVDFVVGVGLEFDKDSDVYEIAKRIQRDGYTVGNVGELLEAIERETENDPDFLQQFEGRELGDVNVKPKAAAKQGEKAIKKVNDYVEGQDPTENAAYEAAMQTPRSETVGAEYTEGLRGAENYALSPDFGREAATAPVSQESSEAAVTIPAQTETNAPTVTNVPADTGSPEVSPSDNENVITVKRAKVSEPAKAVGRITKNGKAIEGGGRYYVYDSDAASVVRYDEAPQNVSFTGDDALAGRLDRVLNTEGSDTGTMFYPEKVADLKTAINTIKRIKTAYGDKGAAVAYNFGDGIVVDAAKVLDVVEALPDAAVQRVPVGNGYYGLKFVSDSGVGFVMPINATDVSVAEDSVFLIRSRNAPASASVVLGNNSWSPAEGESPIPAKSSARVFNDDLTFNLTDDTLTDGAQLEKSEKPVDKKRYSFKSPADTTAHELLRSYTAEERAFIEKNDGVVIDSYETLDREVRRTIEDPKTTGSLYFGFIDDSVILEMEKKITNLPRIFNGHLFNDTKKYSLVAERGVIRHFKRKRGFNLTQTIEYIDKYAPTILESDTIYFDYYRKKGNKTPGLLFTKNFGDGNVVFFDLVSKHGRLSLHTEYIKRKPSAIAAASAAATTAENTAVTTPEAMVDQTFYGDDTTKGTKSQGFSEENAADFEKVRKSAEETSEKVRNIPERARNEGETTARRAAAKENTEAAVKKRGGRNVFRDEKGEYREIAGISDDGAVILDGSAELDVDSLDDETRSAVDTILADLYSGRITEAEAVNMLRNGTLAYVKGDASWFAEELNDGNTAELMSPQMTEKLIGKLFGVYFNYGRVKRKGAMGFMKQGEKTIRTRTVGMLPTVCHELTHVFDFTMGKDLRSLPGINEVIKAAPQSWLNQYAVSKHASEATAWFGEQYFRSRKAAQKISPEFFRNFEAAFTKSELAKLHEVSDVVNRYMAYERDADGNIDTTATLMKQQREQLTSERDDRDMRSFKDKVKGLFRRQETGWFNANAIFENRFGDDASVLYNANIISGAAKATFMIKGTDGLVRKGRHSGGFDTASGKHIDDLQTILSPLEEIMKTDNEAYRDFNLYLTALRGGTKVLQGKRVFASDVANRPAEIQNVIDRLESAHPEFKEIAKNAIEFHRELVKKMCVDTGLMSAEKYKQMAKDDPFYVPFRRDVETSSGVPFTKGFLKTEQRYKRMKGSGRDIYNPVESLFQDAYDTVVSSLKAQYGDFILNKVDTDPANWEWLASNVNAKVNMDVTDLTKQRDAFESELKAAGLDRQAVDAIMNIFDGTVGDEVRDFSTPYYQGEQYFLRVRWEDQGDGTQKRVVKCYQFNDPYAADTMKNAIDNSVSMNSKAMNGLLAVSKFRKIFLTGSSPLFTVRNLIRDAQDAYAYGRISNPVKFVVEYAKAIKSVISGDEAYMRYKEAGGGNSTRLSNDINTVADLIPTVYKAHTKESVRVIRRMLRFAPDMISRANETIEQVPRMMAFKYALEQGLSEEQALFDAANITVNFGQHGANKGAITTLGGVFPFFNAGVQGRYRMYQALKTDPATFLAKKTVTAVVRVGLLTGLIKAFGLEDEYKKLSNYIKNNYYVIPIGKNSFIRLPKDREGGVLDSLIENAVSSLMYGTDGEQWYDYATYLIDQFGGPGTLESLLGYGVEALHDGEDPVLGILSGIGSDTVLSPIFDIIRNEDYRGVKVENATDQKKVRSERYDETTSSTGKLLGKLGLLSPKQWDHLFKSLGFIPSAVLALPENFAEGGVFGPIKDVGETFRSAFTSSSVYSNDAVNDFYDNFEKLELKKNSKDSGGIRAEYAKASGVKQVITELYSMRRAAQSEDEREALTRIIRDTAYDYLHSEEKTDNVARWTEELYDELGGGSDYTFLFPTAPKAVIKADGVEYSLDLLTYLDYVDEYESAMNDAYFRIFVDHTKDSAEDQAKYLKEAKEETEAALKRKYMLKATPSSEKITTDYLKGQIANGYADSGTLKKYVDQERKTREDKGIMQTLANIYKNEYKVAKKSGNNALAKHIEDVLVGLGVGFTAEKIRKWA